MSHFLKRLSLLVLVGFLAPRLVSAGDEEEMKKLAAEREKKAFESLMDKAAEEYRVFFPKPEKVHQFWVAIQFEMETGKYDLAALHLKLMLEQFEPRADKEADKEKERIKQAEEELIKIADRETLAGFTRLKTVRLWSIHEPYHREAEKNVEKLLELIGNLLKARLSDPVLIQFYIANLDAKTPEEREFAIVELNRRRDLILPELIKTLRLNIGTPLGDKIVAYMIGSKDGSVGLKDEQIGPMLEILKVPFPNPADAEEIKKREADARDATLRPILMRIIKARNERRRAKGFGDDLRAMPYLWHLAGTPKSKTPRLPYDERVRKEARELLAYFLKTTPARLPRPEVVLTDMADRIYRDKGFFKGKSDFWYWNGEKLEKRTLSPAGQRLAFAERYAKEALDIAPDYQPAQVVLFSLQMELVYDRDPTKLLIEPIPEEWKAFDDLLARIDPDLLAQTLEKAMDEKNVPVILGTVRALGRRGDPGAAKVVPATPPRGLIRALDYPDRRVQWASLEALLKMPAAPPTVVTQRMVDLIGRNLKTEKDLQAMLIGAPVGTMPKLKFKGGEAELELVVEAEADFRKAFQKLKERGDFDLIILHGRLGIEELPRLINQFRADVDLSMVPVIVLSSLARADALTKDREERDRKEGIKLILKRTREEKLKKILEIDATTKDLGLREKLYEEQEAFYKAETERRVKKFEENLIKEKVSRDLALSRAGEERIRVLLSRFPLVTVVPELHLGMPEEFGKRVEESLTQAYGPPLTTEERALFKNRSLELVQAMATGDIPGFNISPVETALMDIAFAPKASPKEVVPALKALGRFPGTTIQRKLAAIALNPERDPEIRLPAAAELNRHIKKHGMLLGKAQVRDVQLAHAKEVDPGLKEHFAFVLGALAAPPSVTGDTLFEVRPMAVPKKKEEPKEKEKEKKDE